MELRKPGFMASVAYNAYKLRRRSVNSKYEREFSASSRELGKCSHGNEIEIIVGEMVTWS